MLNQKYRPKTITEICGQPLAQRILRSIAVDPENSPRSIVFEGAFGAGKTTSARVLARALNCLRPTKTHDPCGTCVHCEEDLLNSPFYIEYDSAEVGNVERIREIRDSFYISMTSGKRVICFDEVHLASTQSQSALLKSLEEAPPGVYFVFCTTESDKVLPTIRSRSLEIRIGLVPQVVMEERLKHIAFCEGKDIPQDILTIMATRSGGHVRDAVKLLDTYFLVGEEGFRASVRSSRDSFLRLFSAIFSRNKEEAFASVDTLCTYPLAELKVDFQQTVLEIAKSLSGYTSDPDPVVRKLVVAMGSDALKFIRHSLSDWVLDAFSSDLSFQASMLCLVQMFSAAGTQPGQNTQAVPSMMQRAGKR